MKVFFYLIWLTFLGQTPHAHAAFVDQLLETFEKEDDDLRELLKTPHESKEDKIALNKALMKAVEKNLLSKAEILLKAGASPNALSRLGDTLLMIAAHRGFHQIVDLLLAQNGILACQRSIFGKTAETIAKEEYQSHVDGCPEKLKYFLIVQSLEARRRSVKFGSLD